MNPVYPINDNTLRDSADSSGADSGAVRTLPPPPAQAGARLERVSIDSSVIRFIDDLAFVAERWDALPEKVRARIVAMVKATHQRRDETG